ncbi:MAG: histone deacetylase [Verrucomicrobiales bacterium]|nr:histone deacetylase [Verrucomicrobiales bacterium]|tara:strand:+ start:43669 stop:44532 length:864 start_codon:yes stop_codon:yes gene_type:complete
MNIITDERCLKYHQAGHPERPQRVAGTLELLRKQEDLMINWLAPLEVKGDKEIQRAHDLGHIHRVANPPGPFDADTPDYPGINGHARRSLGGALHALKLARKGKPNFSLLRPPGHHATRDQAMGFCYLNSIAVATLAARAAGIKKVAVFDFDVHHGNGTEAILHRQEGCAFFSIHQHPAYPGTGTKSFDNCQNYTVAPGAAREDWRKLATKALADLKAFQPGLVAVSAGFDAYKRDPLCQQKLEAEDFQWVGRQLRALNTPLLNVLEGGYSNDLPELILAYLKGVAG